MGEKPENSLPLSPWQPASPTSFKMNLATLPDHLPASPQGGSTGYQATRALDPIMDPNHPCRRNPELTLGPLPQQVHAPWDPFPFQVSGAVEGGGSGAGRMRDRAHPQGQESELPGEGPSSRDRQQGDGTAASNCREPNSADRLGTPSMPPRQHRATASESHRLLKLTSSCCLKPPDVQGCTRDPLHGHHFWGVSQPPQQGEGRALCPLLVPGGGEVSMGSRRSLKVFFSNPPLLSPCLGGLLAEGSGQHLPAAITVTPEAPLLPPECKDQASGAGATWSNEASCFSGPRKDLQVCPRGAAVSLQQSETLLEEEPLHLLLRLNMHQAPCHASQPIVQMRKPRSRERLFAHHSTEAQRQDPDAHGLARAQVLE